MAHQGYELQLTRYGEEDWRATFYVPVMAHSVAAGSAWQPLATYWFLYHLAAR